ncbi:MAG: N-6 DNA methylase [Candidatus Eremiobacteraeota bacterium]|nr:N-6 DNA methylase [Candidatus Eremiobacteraeota bacterium]
MIDQSKIKKIFSTSDVKHGLSLFNTREIKVVERLITEQDGKFLIKCQIRDKYKVAKPEEIVRQLWIYRLLTEYSYPKDRIDVEKVIYFGSRDSGLADIVVLHEDLTHPYIIFEVKRPGRRDGKDQLKSYCNAEGAPIGVWSNGNEMIRLHREEPNIFIEIPRIPKMSETLRDILTKRWTIDWLKENDELKKGKTTLKKILLDLEELVSGNSGVVSFEEIFKLIYAKLYDEWKGINEKKYQLEFFVGDRSPEQVMRAITNLLNGAKRTWHGVFEFTDKIEMRDTHLKVCVSFLEKIKLFNSNLQVIDEAFEYLIPQVSKKKEGQFFTPRPAEDMVVKMLNPKFDEFVIDPACGSAGFLLHSVMWIEGGMITGKELSQPAKHFAQNNIAGIDFAKKAVKIAKAINLIIGDGKSHIYRDNSLLPQTWNNKTKEDLKERLIRYINNPEKDIENQDNFLYFNFDILMTNPPFAGTVKKDDIRHILKYYHLMQKNGKYINKTGRHILFLERSLHFIRPGGRMAIVLPQGLLNNTNAEYIRRFVIDNARILAVVGLHGNSFKPHTGTKTSVLFLKKYTDEERQKIQEIKLKYEGEWEDFIYRLNDKYKNIDWKTKINNEDLPEELTSFIESYFESTEEIDSFNDEETVELEEVEKVLKEKEEELNNAISSNRKTELKEEIKALNSKINKVSGEISKRTLSGQIWLVLNKRNINEDFKKFWLEGKVKENIDYPIFFAVNKIPLKDNRGEYRYKRKQNGELLIDKNGHTIIDHDLDEIAEAFIKFAKEQLEKGDKTFDFWSDPYDVKKNINVEVSIIKLSEIEDTKRLDAEYYHPKYIKIKNKILQTASYSLWREIGGRFIIGPFGSEFKVDNYVTENSYRYVRGKDVKGFFLIDDDNVYMPQKDFKRLEKHSLREGDVLISVVGTLGNTAIVDESVPPAIFSCKSTAFRTKYIDPFYLIAYLNCKFGRSLLQRKVRGAVQTGLNINDLKSLLIFLPSKKEIQIEIAKTVFDSKNFYNNSKSFYSQAENILLEELGLKDFKPKYELSFVANLSNALGSHRFDAEYFQLAYEEVKNKVKEYSMGYTRLLDHVESIRPNFDPEKYPEKIFFYVELADIDSSIGVINSTNKIKGKEAPSRAKRIVKKGDVIVSSVEGSLKKIALVDQKFENSLASTGFFHFRPTKILPEVLLVLSKTLVLQAQLKRECSGTILTAVPNESLKRIMIPILPLKIQQKIASLVQQSHLARKKAKELLEEAKRKVEEAIENEIKK